MAVTYPIAGSVQEKSMRKPHYELTMEEWADDSRKRTGHIGKACGSRGHRHGHRRDENRHEATIMVHGNIYRHRSPRREDCSDWLRAVLDKRILPTDNKADWLRAEQRKDMMARYQEMTAINCEEGLLVYNYYATDDISQLSEYIEKCLLPHLTYYCCHTLGLGQRNSILYSREAVALLLTKISCNRPVMNMTALCKRIIRTKRNGNTFYYDHMPKDMRVVVDGVDYAPLEQLWKVTKDKRI